MIDTSASDQLSRLMNGYWYTRAIYVAAKLGIADLLKDGPKTADELAAITGTQGRTLYRLMRDLADATEAALGQDPCRGVRLLERVGTDHANSGIAKSVDHAGVRSTNLRFSA